VLNLPQFLEHTQFTSPVDGLKMNSEFPGAPDGSLTQRIEHKIFTEIVSKSDALIDCHGGDINEDIAGFVVASSSGNHELDKISLEMATCYPTALVHVFPSEPQGMSNSAQHLIGIPCIQLEAGTPYPIREEAVQFHIEGTLNVLKYLQMLPGEPKRNLNQLISPKRLKLFSEHNGVWNSRCQLDQSVKKGDVLGFIKNYYGDIIQTIRASADGIISMTRCYYAIKQEELLLVVSTLT
ncbi:succinylglutamate desuccinylase/aspartoacylase family protein, partial [Candidatus Bathyarchaeota archaeon]|nr:succinylglutamate desuccinylase/aspartoacylase family protein [Candidatus Bathyarchaeota archaeon]